MATKVTIYDAFGKMHEEYLVKECKWYKSGNPCILVFEDGTESTINVPSVIAEEEQPPYNMIYQNFPITNIGYAKSTVTLYSLELKPIRTWNIVGNPVTYNGFCQFAADNKFVQFSGFYSVVPYEEKPVIKGCNSCDRNPCNHGQRDSCIFDLRCDKESGYVHWEPLPPDHKFPTFCT